MQAKNNPDNLVQKITCLPTTTNDPNHCRLSCPNLGATVSVTWSGWYAGGGTLTCVDGGICNGGAWSPSTTLSARAGEDLHYSGSSHSYAFQTSAVCTGLKEAGQL